MKKSIETVDSLTNVVMDIVRTRFYVNSDSDLDDSIYSEIHNAIREEVFEGEQLEEEI